jgi:hypothetical protein
LLDRELWHLQAKQIVIEAFVGEHNVRNDGWLRSDTHPRAPGIILSFQSKHGPLRYPCDTYADWEDNLRAIALALEALRAVDRYGVTKIGEQYTGWKQLPGPLVTPPAMTVEEAAEIVAPVGGDFTIHAVIHDAGLYRQAYRARAAELHPDHNDGNDAKFKRLQEARHVLDAHHATKEPANATS